MAISDFRLPVPGPSVVLKDLGDGAVLLSTVDEVYFGVNRVGVRIWSLLPPVTRTFEEMCAVLSGEYSDVGIDRIRRDARNFIEDIVAAGLAVPPTGGASRESVGDSSATPEAP